MAGERRADLEEEVRHWAARRRGYLSGHREHDPVITRSLSPLGAIACRDHSYARSAGHFGRPLRSFGIAYRSFGTAYPSFGTAYRSFGTTHRSFGTAYRSFDLASRSLDLPGRDRGRPTPRPQPPCFNAGGTPVARFPKPPQPPSSAVISSYAMPHPSARP